MIVLSVTGGGRHGSPEVLANFVSRNLPSALGCAHKGMLLLHKHLGLVLLEFLGRLDSTRRVGSIASVTHRLQVFLALLRALSIHLEINRLTHLLINYN